MRRKTGNKKTRRQEDKEGKVVHKKEISKEIKTADDVRGRERGEGWEIIGKHKRKKGERQKYERKRSALQHKEWSL